MAEDAENILVADNQKLAFHLKEVLEGRRKFENAAQSVSRMILESGVNKISRAGRITYDYNFFREGKKHIIGWFEEIQDFVAYVQNAARGGSSAETAYVFVGEPGNGKTFFVKYLCGRYRRFLTRPENRRYTIQFVGLDKLGKYGNITEIESQTFEDPLILAMNLFESQEESLAWISHLGFDDKKIEELLKNYRPLGACTEHIWNDIRSYCDGDIEKMLEFVRVVPVRITESEGAVTGKYSARDKITSSSSDLLGKQDLTRLLNLADTTNPYRYNVRHGALARVAGGGIHFSDEIFRNKHDLVQIYLQVIQERRIELDGFSWPIDTLIIGTSNNEVYNQFVAEQGEKPIKDRCKVCFVSHNTDYKLQQELVTYAMGEEKTFTAEGEEIHEDPNLNYALSVAMALTRLPHSDKLNPVETLKLEAGEVAGEKSVRTLLEIKESLNANQDVTKRWGQKGIGHRGLGRIIQTMLAMPETQEGRCLFARDCFRAIEREILDYVTNAVDRDKFMKDLEEAEKLYRDRIRTSIFNAYIDDPNALKKAVMDYVNMIIGVDSDRLGPDKMWPYRDWKTGKIKEIRIDETYIKSVEERLGLGTQERVNSFRTTIRKIYAQNITTNPNYDFMDNVDLVKAVTDVRLQSDVAGAKSLLGVLANQTHEENVQIKNRMMQTMVEKLGYCARSCAPKTIEYFCEKDKES